MDRYDRQLRLWGKSGQQQLESAHVCIVGKETALLQETLKNLVLAGVSKFTWCCPERETRKYETDGGRSGPKQVTSLFYADIVSDLNPLHPTGKVHIEQKGWSEQVLRTTQWDTFSLIILCGPYFLHSGDVTTKKLPPTLKIYTRGLYGYIFTKLSYTHFILHTHPDYIVPNLGFRHPSPILSSFMSEIDLERFPKDKLAGVPYAVLLFKVLQRVLSSKSDVCVGSIRNELERWYIGEINPQGIADLNYAEAVKFSHLAVLGYNGERGNNSSEVKRTGTYSHLVASAKNYVATLGQVRSLNDKLAVLICCLGTFMEENDGEVIVDKNIPDMESDTAIYNKLKRVYQDWFECDFTRMLQIVRRHPLGKSIEDSLVREFCENAGKLDMIEFTTRDIFGDLYRGDQFSSYPVLETLLRSEQNMSTPAMSPLERRALNFHPTYQTESFMGGIVAQEAIKLITHQFVPVDNIVIYDGLKNSTTTFAYR